MKILSRFSKLIPKDVTGTQHMFFSAVKNGWATGRRYAQINNKGLFSDMFVRGKAIKRNIKLGRNDIPAVTALASSVLPIPGSTIAGYGVGHAIKGTMSIFNRIVK